MATVGFFDVQCSKCRKRFGWSGRFVDRPACPRCGHRPPQTELDADQAELDRHRAVMRTHPGDAGPDGLREQRISAGLTLRQAAKMLAVFPSELSDIENGRRALDPELAGRMADVYDCGVKR